jgi:hypothetical protein
MPDEPTRELQDPHMPILRALGTSPNRRIA